MVPATDLQGLGTVRYRLEVAHLKQWLSFPLTANPDAVIQLVPEMTMRLTSILLILAACGGETPSSSLPFSPETCFADLATALSTDAMEGRGLGTDGLTKSALLIEDKMKAIGLVGGVDGAYRQAFTVQTGVTLGDGNALAQDGAALRVAEDFTPLGFSSSGTVSGQVVFVGYGINAKSLNYNDYADVDVGGKIALALRFEPQEDNAESPFNGRRPSHHSDMRRKAMAAREAGAAALILVAPARDADEPDTLPILRLDGPISDAGLPVVQVTRAVAERWLGGDGLVLEEIRAAIDKDLQPQSKLLSTTVELTTDLKTTTATAENLIGLLPGKGPLAAETVVIGAHYDHLGHGGRGSRAPDSADIHNGADDNASGVAAMLCSAEAIAANLKSDDHRTIAFMGFSAEEVGLGGSAWYVEHPVQPIESIAAMMNLDMVGRVRDNKLSALGSDTAPEWEPILSKAGAEAGLTMTLGGDGYGPSDHMSFYKKGIPVVHFFSGQHDEYHTPADDADLLNMQGGAQVIQTLTASAEALITAPERPTYVEPQGGPAMSGDSRGYGSYLGTVPDYTTMGAKEGGVLLSDVRKGGPADRAGLKGGDRIVKMGDITIHNLYDMVFVLRDNRPGDTIDITVLRDEKEVSLTATLSKKPSGGAAASGHGALSWSPTAGKDASHLLDERETHLANLRQLTFGGENAEAYWSPDGKSLIFQRTPPTGGCDQQYIMSLDSGEVTRVSSGDGRTTCGYYMYPKGDDLIYATTEGGSKECPAPPDRSQGYVWPLYDTFDLVVQDGISGEPKPFLPSPAYDAEATVCFTDGRVVFTSTRDGDLELYVADADGSNLKRLTTTPGYDGGAFFTADCEHIVWRASRPQGEQLADYQRLLEQGLVRPSALEVFIMKSDGSDVRQLTDNGAANFGPYPSVDGKHIIFSSNMGDSPREFELWRVPVAGGQPEQITFSPEFDGFPMFSPDGQHLVFASNRGGTDRQTNLFVAKWVD